MSVGGYRENRVRLQGVCDISIGLEKFDFAERVVGVKREFNLGSCLFAESVDESYGKR